MERFTSEGKMNEPLNYLRLRSRLLSLACADDTEVIVQSTITRADNEEPERDRVFDVKCVDGRVVIFADE